MKKHSFFIIKLLLCLTILFFIIKNIDFTVLAKLIKTANLNLLITSTFVLFFCFSLVTFRWLLILKSQAINPKFTDLLKINLIGLFFNNFFLGANGGDLVKMVFINKAIKKDNISAMTSIFLDRIIGFGSFLILGTVMVLFNYEIPVFRRILKIIIPCYAMIFLFLIMFINKQKISRLFFLKKLIKSEKIKNILNKIYNSIYIFRHRKKNLLGIMSVSFLAQFFLITSIFLIGLSLPIDNLAFTKYVTLVPIIQIISAIPVSFSGLGITEGAYVYFFNIFDVSFEKAFAVSFFYRIMIVFWGLIGGVIFYFEKKSSGR